MSVNELVAKWRGDADNFPVPTNNEDRGYSNALYNCADELEAALQQQSNEVGTSGEAVGDHPIEDRFQHFLAYSGFTESGAIRYAYYHGADAKECESLALPVELDDVFGWYLNGVFFSTRRDADEEWNPAGVVPTALYTHPPKPVVSDVVKSLKDRTFPNHECPAESAAVWNTALYEIERALGAKS